MTTTSINADKSTPKTNKQEPKPRSVTITHAEAHDGRLPVVVTVVPLADFDAKGGVFVDFRRYVKTDGGNGSGASLKAGDAAVAALAAQEIKAEEKPAAASSAAYAKTEPSLAAAVSDAPATAPAPVAKQLVSHQISMACKLTVGQAETFRAEVAMPEVGADWYMRGRFAAIGASDLTSAWLHI